MSVAGKPSKVTERFAPTIFEPFTVASDPATNGVVAKVAALTTLLTVTAEGGGMAIPDWTTKVTGIVALPASGPASITTFAWYVPAASPCAFAVTVIVAPLMVAGSYKDNRPVALPA